MTRDTNIELWADNDRVAVRMACEGHVITAYLTAAQARELAAGLRNAAAFAEASGPLAGPAAGRA